jgi:hypothetical protein
MDFTLDFQTIQQVMQAHHRTGWLFAEAPSGVAGIREPCRIEINVIEGKITSCALISRSGQHIAGNQAAAALSRLGRLRWTFTPDVEVTVKPVSPTLSPGRISFFPQRTMQLRQEQMRTWSRMYKAIFALADGTKSVAKIAEILSIPRQQVERALRDLQSAGVIEMVPKRSQ